MSSPAAARTAMVSALSSLGIPVHTYPAGSMPPPCAWLVPGSPYVDPGITWGASQVALDLRIAVNNASGADAMKRLDALIDSAVTALIAAGLGVGTIGAPYTSEDSAALVVEIPTTTV